jgi:predicted metal-dependent phosphoesterase TrpH
MIFDLHTHTTASDGSLSPAELIARAQSNGVTTLSITDHDTVLAYQDLDYSSSSSLNIVPGIEVSANWGRMGIHIVGLNIDLDSPVIGDLVQSQGSARLRRAEEIARRLARSGMPDPLPEVRQIAGSDNIGRPHFAQYLVDTGKVRNTRQAYRKFLGNGKIGDVRNFWPSMQDAIDSIRDSGGIAVLAHPAHYRLTNTKLHVLTSDFSAAGGGAIEVICGRQEALATRKLAGLAEEFGLLASVGSDFHSPQEYRADVGAVASLPAGCKPVWQAW